jgi:hypothetical protein
LSKTKSRRPTFHIHNKSFCTHCINMRLQSANNRGMIAILI